MKNQKLSRGTFIIAVAALAASVSFALYALFLAPAETYSPPAVGAGRAVVEANPCDESRIAAPEDIPEGWTWHVFSDACIGFAFPTTESGKAIEYGESDDMMEWDGKLIHVRDNVDFEIYTRGMDVMVGELSREDKSGYANCFSYGEPGFLFCRNEIVDDWTVLGSGDGQISYIQPPDQLPDRFVGEIVANAATVTDSGLLVTYGLTDDSDRSSDIDEQDLLAKIVGTVSIGR